MDTTTLVVILLIVVLLFGSGYWGYSSRTYYGPGLVGIIVLVLLILLLTGRLA